MDWSARCASITRWCGLMSLFFLGNHWNHGKPWKNLPTLMNRKPSQPVDISLVQHQVTRTCRLIFSIHLRPLDAEQQLLPFCTVKMTHWNAALQHCQPRQNQAPEWCNYITSINMILLKPVWWFGKIWKNVKNWTRHSTDQLAWSRMKYNSNRINDGNIFSICFRHDA